MILTFEQAAGKQDGVDHINVFSLGKTELGKLLSNFAHTPFRYKGKLFESVEGFWYYKVSGGDVKFQFVYGKEAKDRGKEIINRHPTPTREELKEAYNCKLRDNPNITKLLLNNTLPLAHYYKYFGPPISADKYLWTIELWDEIRTELKAMIKQPDLVGQSWYDKLQPFFQSDDYKNILKELKKLKDKGRIIRPKFENTFINLKNVPFDKVKVVMLMNIGMDKSQNDKIADALVDAIKKDTGESPVNIWKTPLVLLLPLNITTCDGENHTELWKPFIVAVMKALQSKPGLIYCFIGKDTRNHVLAVDQTCNDFHYIEHPMQAIMNNRPWDYQNVFEKINRASNFLNDEKIKWS